MAAAAGPTPRDATAGHCRGPARVASAATRSPGRRPVKPAPFTYHRTRTVAETVALLSELGDEAKIMGVEHVTDP